MLTLLRMETELASSDAEILVDRWLVTKCAEKEGLIPDDAAVLEYLQLLTQVVQYGEGGAATAGSIPSESLTAAMRVAGLNESGLRDLLKNQIAYERMIRKVDAGRRMDAWYNTSGIEQMAFGHGEPLSTPADALAAYDALNRMVKAKVAVFKASSFVEKVAEPSEAVAKKFYQQYRNVTFHADSATPGFTQPVKLALELVRADIDDEVLDAISMDDVKQYYEEHKEEFRIPKSSAPAANAEPAAEAVTLPGADAPALNALPDDAINSFGADAEEPAETAPATDAPAEEPAPVQEAPAEEPAPATDAPAEGAVNYAVSEQLVAYQQEAEGTASAEEAPDEEPAPAEEAPAEEPAPAEEAPAEDTQAEEVDSEYLPLEDVERFIRSRIAAERIEAKMATLTGMLQDFYRETISEKEGAPAPKDVDMAAYAAENGLKYLKTTRPNGENAAFPVRGS
jgi:hypothetical protein